MMESEGEQRNIEARELNNDGESFHRTVVRSIFITDLLHDDDC